MRANRVTSMCALMFCICACGRGGGLGTPVSVFPSKAELDDVLKTSPKPLTNDDKVVQVPSWTIVTPAPGAGNPYPLETSWDKLLAEVTGSPGHAQRSPALRCAAEETARFYVQTGGMPDEALRSYLVARCGGTAASARFRWLSGETSENESDDQLFTAYAKQARQMLAEEHASAQTELGLGFARGQGRGALVLFSVAPRAALSNYDPLVTSESVSLEGSVQADSVFVMGVINQGSLGVSTCSTDPAFALPRFHLTCPFSPSDDHARIEVAVRKQEQVLMDVELNLLVRRNDQAGLEYQSLVGHSDAVAQDAAAFEAALLADLDDARKSAGLAAFTAESKQSNDNRMLAPYLYQAAAGNDTELANRISLGLLAGWDIDGVIRDGGIYWGSVYSARSPGRLVAAALESPFGRHILLDPDATHIAVGAVPIQPSGAMALLTTYSFFRTSDHGGDENAVFEQLTRQRLARHHTAPHRTVREVALDTALAQIATLSATSGDALQGALARVVHNEQRSVSGWINETNDLRQLKLSDELLTREPLDVEVGVTHYKAPGGAWGQYAVIFLIRQNGPERTARAAPRARF